MIVVGGVRLGSAEEERVQRREIWAACGMTAWVRVVVPGTEERFVSGFP